MADATKKSESRPASAAAAEPHLTARQRLEAELKRDSTESARLHALVNTRRVEGGELAAKDAAAKAAAFEAAHSRVGEQEEEFNKELAILAVLGNELSPLGDNLEGYTRAICRMVDEGSTTTEEFARRSAALKETSDAVVDLSSRLRGSIIRLKRLIEPRM